MILENMTQVNEVKAKDFSIVLAITHTCSVCKVTKAQLNTILKDTPLDFDEVYIDDVPEFRGEHLVWAVPTVIVFSGGREILRESRFINIGNIEKLVHRFLD